MNKFFLKLSKWVKARFDNVWNTQYPFYWHIIDLCIGIIIGITFAILYKTNLETKIGLFFIVTFLGYLICLAFTYGIVRSRKGWTKKRK